MTAIVSAYEKRRAALTNKSSRKITRRRLDASQTVQLYELLKRVLVPADNGLFTYEGNYSDAEVAKELGIAEKSVLSTRLKLFGKLKLKGEYVPYSVLLQKFHELNERLTSLEQQLGIKSN